MTARRASAPTGEGAASSEEFLVRRGIAERETRGKGTDELSHGFEPGGIDP
jgi:hypothetical protein